ncbi:Bug family tripartite tricarboxylate transporter substrate binding protein [Roseomonas sp. CCTCC AB2023176]|uniref:Bug family tripartite tricarboxylate transporter substrate binding protein n=1 Tax=Roseomonas sp. CCTCC AB2023176 TaxID=3342640 RepID=UPI0035E2CCA4
MRRLLVALALALITWPALAQLPDRPVRLVVGSPPGGTTDIMSRLLAEAVDGILPRGAVVENRPGANGNIAMGEVARSTPDGTTLIVCAFGPCGANPALYANPGYDLARDFAPVILTGAVRNVMVVRRDFPARTLQELLAKVRAEPGRVTFASSGAGASNHLGPEMLRTRFGLDWTHVPYRGSAPAITDLIAGNVDVFFDNLPSILPHIRAGSVRPVAVVAAERVPELPDVPTFAEAGAPGVVIDSWFGLMAPARTPPATVAALNAAFSRAMDKPDFAARARAAGITPIRSTPDEMAAHVRAEAARWAEVVRTNGIRAE